MPLFMSFHWSRSRLDLNTCKKFLSDRQNIGLSRHILEPILNRIEKVQGAGKPHHVCKENETRHE